MRSRARPVVEASFWGSTVLRLVVASLVRRAARVPGLVKNLLDWFRHTDAHPLIASSVFHYELEFIHPFSDGNGRMGRFWQTLILSRWNPLLAWLPVESVIHARQADYYHVLAACDKAGNSTAFIEFVLTALHTALGEAAGTDPVDDPVTDQVASLLRLLGKHSPLAASEGMKRLKLAHRPTFRSNYLRPALTTGFVELTLADKPNSRLQK